MHCSYLVELIMRGQSPLCLRWHYAKVAEGSKAREKRKIINWK
jgi:hypothetical protein